MSAGAILLAVITVWAGVSPIALLGRTTLIGVRELCGRACGVEVLVRCSSHDLESASAGSAWVRVESGVA